MGVDAKGVAKDNSKLILSVLGIVILTVMIGTVTTSGDGIYDFYDTTGTIPGNNDDPNQGGNNNGNAQPVSNGNDDKYAVAPTLKIEEDADYQAIVVTNKGTIEIDLFEDSAPINVNNFIFLANEDFYDGTTFYRVMKDYIIQGGDPLGNGEGGPGYYVEDEIFEEVKFQAFVVAMASSEDDANGSQFFITTRGISDENIERYLEGDFTIIGRVIDGFNVVDNIELVDVDADQMPYEPVMIEDVYISDVSDNYSF